jgi:hypothetical protein
VEETLNALLEAEADRLCNAQRYERSEAQLRGFRLTKAAELAEAGIEETLTEAGIEETLTEAGIEETLTEAGIEETLTYYAFPEEHWRRIRTTDVIDKPFRAEFFGVRAGFGIFLWRGRRRRMRVLRRGLSVAPQNAKLKKLLADAMLDNAALKDLLAKKW